MNIKEALCILEELKMLSFIGSAEWIKDQSGNIFNFDWVEMEFDNGVGVRSIKQQGLPFMKSLKRQVINGVRLAWSPFWSHSEQK